MIPWDLTLSRGPVHEISPFPFSYQLLCLTLKCPCLSDQSTQRVGGGWVGSSHRELYVTSRQRKRNHVSQITGITGSVYPMGE